MITSPSTSTSYLTSVDREWLTCFRDSVRSLTAFALSVSSHADDLVERAAAVTIWHCGRFQAVRELVDECVAHHWNGTIYEAWVLETSNRVQELIWAFGDRDDAAAKAVEVYARHLDCFKASYDEAMKALDEAARWRDGES